MGSICFASALSGHDKSQADKIWQGGAYKLNTSEVYLKLNITYRTYWKVNIQTTHSRIKVNYFSLQGILQSCAPRLQLSLLVFQLKNFGGSCENGFVLFFCVFVYCMRNK